MRSSPRSPPPSAPAPLAQAATGPATVPAAADPAAIAAGHRKVLGAWAAGTEAADSRGRPEVAAAAGRSLLRGSRRLEAGRESFAGIRRAAAVGVHWECTEGAGCSVDSRPVGVGSCMPWLCFCRYQVVLADAGEAELLRPENSFAVNELF